MAEDLEIVIKQKIRPIIDEVTEKHMGVSIDKLSEDITSRLDRTALIDIEVDTRLPYKVAKRKFKKRFLTKLLLLNLGNISEVARITGKNRRSIHRLIRTLSINIKKIKKELIRPYDMRLESMSHMIENALHPYQSIVHPTRMETMYANIHNLSEDILKEMPQQTMSFEQAQLDFEHRYFIKTLNENNHNIAKTAKKIKLRYETLLRKLRSLHMI